MALSDTIEYKLGKLAGLQAAYAIVDQYANDTLIDLATAKTPARREDALAELGALREVERLVRTDIKKLMNEMHEGATHASHE